MIIDGLDEFLEKVAREAVQGDLAQGGPTAQPGSELVPHLEFTATHGPSLGGQCRISRSERPSRGNCGREGHGPRKLVPEVAVSRFGQEEREARRGLGESP